MTTQRRVANPFALMTDPQSILEAMGRSERLDQLKRRVCRPLDGPAPGKEGEDNPSEQAADSSDDEA